MAKARDGTHKKIQKQKRNSPPKQKRIMFWIGNSLCLL